MTTVRARRLDVSTLASPTRRDNGTAVFDGFVARTGILTYDLAGGGKRRELVRPETLFDPASTDTLKLVPVTSEHPPGLLDGGNARSYAVGAVGENVRSAGDWLAAPLGVFDGPTVDRADAGDNELSCGYECDLDMTPGVWQGQPYDCEQKNRTYNHLAITRAARAGAGAAMRMDSADPAYGVCTMPNADDLTAEQRSQIPDKHFAAPPDKLPIEDPEHLRAAMARFNQTSFASAAEKKAAYHKILARAHELNVSSAGFEKAHGDDAAKEPADATYQHAGYGAEYDAADAGMRVPPAPADQPATMEQSATGDTPAYADAKRPPPDPDGDNDVKMDRACATTEPMQGSCQMPDIKNDSAATGGMTTEQALASLHAQLAETRTKLVTAEADAAAQKTRADALDGKLIEVKKDLDAAQHEVATGAKSAETAAVIKERERADSAELRVARFDADFEKRVAERADLQARAMSVLGAGYRFDSKMTDRDILAVVVKHLDPRADVSNSIGEGVLRGRFDAMLERYHSTARDIARTADVKAVAAGSHPHADAYESYHSAQNDRWRKPLPSASQKA